MRGARTWPAVLALLAVMLGLVLVIGAAVALGRDRRTSTAFGATTPNVSLRPIANGDSTSSGALTPGPASSTQVHAATAHPAAGLARPTRLRVPSLNVSAPVDQVVTHNGLLDVPENIRHVGWWTGSVRPGAAAGATVIVGHVDSAANGEGALFHLTDLRAGQRITVSTSTVHRVSYQVYARRIYTKSRPLPESLFTMTGPARLVLITCGGPFDTAARSYLDNIAVFAQPVAS